jgi:hypothetical protein
VEIFETLLGFYLVFSDSIQSSSMNKLSRIHRISANENNQATSAQPKPHSLWLLLWLLRISVSQGFHRPQAKVIAVDWNQEKLRANKIEVEENKWIKEIRSG